MSDVIEENRELNDEQEIESDHIISPSVSRAVQIIEFLSQGSSTLADLSKRLRIPKSTLHGIIATLVAHKWLAIEGRQISLGAGLFQTVIRYGQNDLLKPTFQEVGRQIVKATGETTFLGILKGHKILHLARVDGTAPVRYVAEEGEQGLAHTSALGKVLLAEYPGEEIEKIFDTPTLAALTSRSITTLDQLLKELSVIHEQGYALDFSEVVEGLCCVAVPIRDASQYAIASIALAAPEFRFVEHQKDYIELVCQAAMEISARLGYKA